MGHVEELSDNDEVSNLTQQVAASKINPNARGEDGSSTIPDLPPAMQEVRSQSVDELLTHLNRSPLFMTELDESDGQGGSNVELEALKALAYEGTRAEVGENFKGEGNDLVKSKRWDDAREFYSKAIAVLTAPRDLLRNLQMTDGRLDGGEGPAEVDWLQKGEDELTTQPENEEGQSSKIIDIEEEEMRERVCLEACYVNRALCNLELKNFGSVNKDCAEAIKMNPKNIKALYRSAQACLALDKIEAAYDACIRGLTLEPFNQAISNLLAEVEKRKATLERRNKQRLEREKLKRQEAAALNYALKTRNITIKLSKEGAPDMQDAKINLENPMDSTSMLRIPVLFLYPTAAQSDFVKEAAENQPIGAHLEYLLPAPKWDTHGQFQTSDNVECFVDTVEGGLLKVGKKVALVKILANDKVELADGLAKVYIVPKDKIEHWIEETKQRRVK